MSETLRTCVRCQTAKPLAAYGRYRPAADGLRKTCRACMAHAQNRAVPRLRTAREAAPLASSEPVNVAPVPAPGPAVMVDPWRFAPRSGPFAVNVSRPGPLPLAARFPACERECVERVLTLHAPPVFREVHHDHRGHGHRAVLRPAVARVSALAVAGPCAACGGDLAPAFRSPDSLLIYA